MKKIKYVYELTQSTYYEKFDEEIEFIYYSDFSLTKALESIEKIKDCYDVELDEINFYTSLVATGEITKTDLLLSITDITGDTKISKQYTKKDIKDIVKWFLENEKEHLIYDIIYNNNYNNDILEAINDNSNLQAGTVGYSDWSYYIAPSDTSKSYITDIYEGYNFYDIIEYKVLENNELVFNDSLSQCYITKNDDLKEYINDYFNLESEDTIYILDDENTQYFDDSEDIKKIKASIITKTYLQKESE
jgi:hypothetical protein